MNARKRRSAFLPVEGNVAFDDPVKFALKIWQGSGHRRDVIFEPIRNRYRQSGSKTFADLWRFRVMSISIRGTVKIDHDFRCNCLSTANGLSGFSSGGGS